ncbi:MAG: 6-phosphogluconolactonase [Lentimonas sp.]|jgi:6-phosphogluconolactonase
MSLHAENTVIFVGSYTETVPGACGDGVSVGKLNLETGSVQPLAASALLPNPSYLIQGDDGTLYVASEVVKSAGRIAALRYQDNSVQIVWEADSGGRATCHVSHHSARKLVGVASYIEGASKLVSSVDGTDVAAFEYRGSGPNAKRQAAAHPHQVLFSNRGRWMLVTDLGSDRIWVHDLDDLAGDPGSRRCIILPPGTGPRHAIFSKDLSILYVIGELDGQVHWGKWDEDVARCEWLDSISIQPEDAGRQAHSSAIQLHPLLPILYAADRTTGLISLFDITESGSLVPKCRFSGEGEGPRDFVISPDGRWLLVACQQSNSIVSHQLDVASGIATGIFHVSDWGSPVCVLFGR